MSTIKELVVRFVSKRNISYLLINIGNIPIMTLVSAFLAIYYVDVIGMNEYVVGTMFLVARIFDGINDPIIGSIIDKIPGEKLSKFKRVLWHGTIICIFNYLLLWIGPQFFDLKYSWMVAVVAYLALGVTFPIMDISLNSLIPIMSSDKDDRETLSSLKIIGYGLGTVIIEILVPVVLAKRGSTIPTYNWVIVGFSVLVVLLTFFGLKGLNASHLKNDFNGNAINEENGMKNFLKIFFENNVFSTFLSGVFFYTGNAALAVSNTYYATYYLGNVKYLAWITIATYSLEMFVVLLVSKVTDKYGSKKVFSYGLIVSAIGIVLRFIPWGNSSLLLINLLVSSAIFGFGYGFVMILFYSIQAQNVSRVNKKINVNAEGTIASTMSMVNKFGKGIGGALPLYILGIMKMNNGDYSSLSFRIIDGLLPALLFLVAGIIFYLGYREE